MQRMDRAALLSFLVARNSSYRLVSLYICNLSVLLQINEYKRYYSVSLSFCNPATSGGVWRLSSSPLSNQSTKHKYTTNTVAI
jgi:hypothetical protein